MKFNILNKTKAETINHEGAKAYTLSPEFELYTTAVTTMLNDITYETADKRMERIINLVSKAKPEFVAQLAIYMRKEMNMRSAPVMLTTELAKVHSGDSLVSKTVEKIVQRPDEIMELLAYYQITNKRSGTKKLSRISKQMQKGLAASFNTFDEYQFAKYNQNTAIKLRDALFLVHPKAKDENQQLVFNKIVNNDLATPYTWETELSALGQQSFETENARNTAFKAKWEALIDSKKMGYMATLRNLRNILEAEVSASHIKKVCSYLVDEKAVAGSKQLPFRFLSAYRELKVIQSGYTASILNALEDAILTSVINMKGFDLETRVVIACDVSGSMQKNISPKSKIMLYDIGLLLGMLLQSKCKNVMSGIFGNTWKTVGLPTRNVLENVQAFYNREGEVGYSTNGYLVLEDLIKRKYVADKIMIFTDAQLWNSNVDPLMQNTMESKWATYKKIAPKAQLYLFDLAGYGHAPLKTERSDVHLIAGWSDKIFDVLKALENGEDVLGVINKIKI